MNMVIMVIMVMLVMMISCLYTSFSPSRLWYQDPNLATGRDFCKVSSIALLTIPPPVFLSLSSAIFFFIKIVESENVVGVEGALWEGDKEDEISDSELNSNRNVIFSLSLSWVRGQTDDDDMFSLSLSEVFDQLCEVDTVASTIIIGLMSCAEVGSF